MALLKFIWGGLFKNTSSPLYWPGGRNRTLKTSKINLEKNKINNKQVETELQSQDGEQKVLEPDKGEKEKQFTKLAISGRDVGGIKYIFKSFQRSFGDNEKHLNSLWPTWPTSGDSIFELGDNFLVFDSSILKPNGHLSFG